MTLIKRLMLSVLIIGGVGAGLLGGAFAFFSDSQSHPVTITTATPDLLLDGDATCEAAFTDRTYATFPGGTDLTWDEIVPGDEERDCFKITNDGEGTMTVYSRNQGFGGSAGLRAALTFAIVAENSDDAGGDDSIVCGPVAPEDFAFTGNNGGLGCELGTIAQGQSIHIQLRSAFPDSGANQNSLIDRTATWDNVIEGIVVGEPTDE